MDRYILLRVGWKILAVLIIPILIIAVIIIINSSGGKNKQISILKNIEPSSFNLWPEGRVPYTIEPYMEDAKLLIKNAMKIIQEKTCVKFVDKKQSSDEKWLNFVRNDDLCFYSSLGMDITKKGQEKIEFGLDCLTVPTIQKSIGRSLGLEFEETRPDRDKFITFVQGCKRGPLQDQGNLSAISNSHNEAALEIYFDYTSHMFNGVKCLQALNSAAIKLGSGEDSDSGSLSVLDIEKLNAIYNCPGCNSYRFRPVNKLTESVYSFEYFKPIQAGYDLDGIPFYICRVYHLGSIRIGKLKVTAAENLCWIEQDGKEYRYGRRFEVLTNPREANLTWKTQVGPTMPSNAVRGGRTADRQTLFIGRCSLQSQGKTSVIPSSVFPGNTGLKVPFGHVSHHCSTYDMLVCND